MQKENYTNKKIGEMLVEKNIITNKQLEIALDQQRQKGGYLCQHLIKLGFASDVDITMCLANKLGMPYISLENFEIPKKAIDSIPLKLIITYCFIPVEKTNDSITIAVSDPMNYGIVETLIQILHCRVNVFIGTYREIKNAIKQYYNDIAVDFDLDRFKDEMALRDDLADNRINNYFYNGLSRRRYRRLNCEAIAEYFTCSDAIRTKTKNISMGGLLFDSSSTIDRGAQLSIMVYLNNGKQILATIEVVRSELKDASEAISSVDSNFVFSVAGRFVFIPKDDQQMLAEYLKEEFKTVSN